MLNARSALLTADVPAPKSGDWDRLRARLQGDLVLPDDPGYAFAKQLQNVPYDKINPLGIAYCEQPQDIRTCVELAQHNGLAAHVRSGGHSMGGWSTGAGLVIDVSRINHVSVDGPMVHIGAGTRSVEAMNALRPHNTQIVTGTFPTVSAGGFLSGGGIGWQTRKSGIGSDRIVSARVMLADGRLVRCSAVEEPDLFWAVRGGGGGNFGIIVDFVVRPIEAPLMVAYETIWRLDEAVDLLAAWQAWCVAGPDELGSSLVVLPPFGPDGLPVVKVWGGFLGPRAALETALDKLAEHAGAVPISRMVRDPEPFCDAMHQCLCGDSTLDECQRTGHNPSARGHRHPFTVQTYYLTDRAVSRDEAARLLAAWDPDLNRERYLLCIAIGGAANEVSRTATAYVHRDARFLVGYQIALRDTAAPPEHIAEITAWVDRADGVLAPLRCGSYINFPSTRRPEEWGTAHYGENYPRLLDVKRHYDPGDFFQHAGEHPQHSRPVVMEIRGLDGDDPATIRALLPGFQETMRQALPNDPPASGALLARLLQRRRGTDRIVLAAVDADEPVGYAKLGLDLSTTVDVGHGSLWVFPAHRRAGAGRLLVQACRAELRARGRRCLLVDAPHTPEAAAFTETLGGKRIVTNLRNQLLLSKTDRGELAARAAAELPGYRTVRWNERCPEELVDAFASVWRHLDVAVNGQAVVGEVTATDVRAKEAEALRAEHRQYAAAAVHDETGVVAGYSTMFVRNSPMADAGETLVLPAHRRRGLAARLKAELVCWAAEENPQLALVQAWNDERNSAVAALNRKLGYVVSGVWATYKFAV